MPVPVNSLNRVSYKLPIPQLTGKALLGLVCHQDILINDTTSASLSLRTSQTPASLRDQANKKH